MNAETQKVDGEVVGIDTDGCLLLWNAETEQTCNCGESLQDFGIDNLSAAELARVGGAA